MDKIRIAPCTFRLTSDFNERLKGLSKPSKESCLGLTYFGLGVRVLKGFVIYPCT